MREEPQKLRVTRAENLKIAYSATSYCLKWLYCTHNTRLIYHQRLSSVEWTSNGNEGVLVKSRFPASSAPTASLLRLGGIREGSASPLSQTIWLVNAGLAGMFNGSPGPGEVLRADC